MSCQDSSIMFRSRTKRLYTSSSTRATPTTAPATTSSTVSTGVIVRELSGRIRGVHERRDVRVELVEPRAEIRPAIGVEPRCGEQGPRADQLEALEPVAVVEPLHHLPVEQREGELLLL